MRTIVGRLAGTLLALVLTSGLAAAQSKVTVAIGGGACLCYLPTVLARQLGEYEKAGLAVELVDLKGGSDALKAVLGGSADVVSGYFDHCVNLAAKKQEMTAFVVYDRYPGLVLVVSPSHNAEIKSIKDLAGKKVAFTSPGSVTNMLILMCLKSAGMKPSDVKLLPAGDNGANLAAVLNRAVDAAMNGEPLYSENKAKIKPVFWSKDCFPPEMTQTVGITTTEFAATGGDKLRAILEARREGVEYIIKNPDESADIVAKAYNGDPKLYRDVFRHFVEIKYFGDGRFNFQGMNRMAEGMQLVGTLKAPPDWKAMIDPQFLPKELMPTQ